MGSGRSTSATPTAVIGFDFAVPFGELPGPALEAERSGDANQVVYLPFTSGTTSEPKGVMHSDNTLLATARAMSRDWRLERAVLCTLSPLSHNLGLGALITALAGGGELVLHDLRAVRAYAIGSKRPAPSSCSAYPPTRSTCSPRCELAMRVMPDRCAAFGSRARPRRRRSSPG